MKTYKTEIDIKSYLNQIYSRLSLIEVRGESVDALFSSKMLIKEMFDKIEESKDGT